LKLRRPIHVRSLVVLGVFIAAFPQPVTARDSEARAAASCARRADGLVRLTRAYERTPRGLRRYVGASDPICFDFTREGRTDVAFAIQGGGTGGAFEWTLFRRTSANGGRLSRRFSRLTERGKASKTRLRREGSLLVVSNPIYRSGDPNCCPSGGVVERRYRFSSRGATRVGTRRRPAA
jgi:hypothetical protein